MTEGLKFRHDQEKVTEGLKFRHWLLFNPSVTFPSFLRHLSLLIPPSPFPSSPFPSVTFSFSPFPRHFFLLVDIHKHFLGKRRNELFTPRPYSTRRDTSRMGRRDRPLFDEMPLIQINRTMKPHGVIEAHGKHTL